MNLEPSWSSQAEHSIFVTPEGGFLIWGHNLDGSLGLGTDTAHKCAPITLDFPKGVEGGDIVSLACGQRHSIALTRDGRVVGWGRGSSEQLGPERVNNIKPSLLTFPERPIFIAAGGNFAAVITEGGALHGWRQQ
jgi:alpha-tubulin suppressor-like RCC1 family protein